MKTSGNRVMMIVSAVILGSMLIVPVLPTGHSFFKNDVCQKEIDAQMVNVQGELNNSSVSVGLSIGREISIRL